MSSTLILFKEIGRQILIVGLVLGACQWQSVSSGSCGFCRSVATLWQRNSSGRAGQRHIRRPVF